MLLVSTTTNKKPTKKATQSKTDSITLNKSDLAELMKIAATAGAQSSGQAIRENIATIGEEIDKSRKLVVQRAAKELDQYQMNHRNFVVTIQQASEKDLVWYSIPKVYKPYLATVKVCWNGAVIYLQADGKRRKIHKGFLPMIGRKLAALDDDIDMMNDNDQYAGISMYVR